MKVVIHFNKGKNKLLIVVKDIHLEVPLSWDLNQIKDYFLR